MHLIKSIRFLEYIEYNGGKVTNVENCGLYNCAGSSRYMEGNDL